jgi:hypothetical protein
LVLLPHTQRGLVGIVIGAWASHTSHAASTHFAPALP